MNKKKLFLKLLIIVVGISAVFLLSSCFTTAIGFMSCKKSWESCRSNNSDKVDGNEYGIYYTLSDDGASYYVSEVGYNETSVVIPETYEGKPVVGIRRGAFTHIRYGSGCSGSYYFGNNFTSLTLPKTIRDIEPNVFYGDGNGYYYNGASCAKVNFEGTLEDWFDIKFGSSPLYGDTVFYIGGKIVTDVVVPESVTKIGENAFAYYKGLKSVTFHENVAIIESNAFYGCENLEELNFPCKDLTVWENAFSVCSNIKTVNFTGEKIVLGRGAFNSCTGLQEVNWNTVSITAIPEYAFSGCTALKTFVIPSSVAVIRENAFSGCYGLEEVYNLSELNVVAGSNAHGGVAYYAGVVHTSEDDGSYILTVNEYKFAVNDAGCTLFKYTGEGGALNLPVPSGVEAYEIRQGTFLNIDGILSVNLPDCVTAVGERAFFGCKNLKIVSGCAGLLTVGEQAFAGCSSLESIALASVEEIGAFAFNNCDALKVTLPQSLKKLGRAAFGAQTELAYAGTSEEWQNVGLSSNASEAVKVTCSDGEVWEGEI